MNCDQAFDQLTNPRLTQRDALERHLQNCPRCRQMQETLEPALACFNEDGQAAAESFAGMSPNIEGVSGLRSTAWSQARVSPEAVAAAESAAARLAASPASFRVRARQYFAGAVRYAAVFVLGSLMAWSIGSVNHSSAEHGMTTLPTVGTVPCIRKEVASANSRAASSDARSVVLSCNVCHLPAP